MRTLARFARRLELCISPGMKLLSLTILGVGVFWFSHWSVLCVLAAGVLFLFVLSKVPVSHALGMVRDLAFVLAVVCASQVWLQGVQASLISFLRIVTLVWAAGLVAETTAFSEMTEALKCGLTPLRRLGVDPERWAFAMALTIRFVPMLRQALQESRQAQQARGLQRRPLALIVPVVIRVLRLADRITEAVEARGIFAESAHASRTLARGKAK